ncbi:MGH1-like glycoside hydrolase domain-containing protein [Gemmatirosa kalamazoonensis]|uniref:MGH1-like glycoside hydrolase domain-containing protein n=1 Tax=Gemmatirosa kalamazoonensis TaxID=861299 RepID=UPI0011DDA6B2|nr:glycosyl hydrolase family 65 protein [Gemmatirosa kalamazoonensis]
MHAQVLDKRAQLARYDWLDNRDYDWFAERIPFFESPEPELDATYYYRWELLTKHLTYGDPRTGYTFTEFIDRPFWSGAYGAISCPLGHQFAEVRWLKDRRVIDDFARYWFETPGAQPRSYSNWYGDAMWGTFAVLGDTAFLHRVLPYMKRQYDGWVAERFDAAHGLFHWDGLHDGMERNINSRQTDDVDEGADGYRPTLNSYLFADARAISRASALFGDSATARLFAERAAAIKRRVQEELWDARRGFFLHQNAHDDRDGLRAKARTYDSGKYAGNPHGRELLGYVPWQFSLPDSGYERAWWFLMDTAYFAAPHGPTTAERHDPLFLVAPRCCHWSGNSWPYATAQTLDALANLLNDYHQSYVTKRDYATLLRTYARTQRKQGRPYVAEAANPDDGSWAGHDTFDHSEHYFHSSFVDLVVTGLVGLRPRADDTLEVNPLAPDEWLHFALDDVAYHGHRVSVLWDRDGSRYRRGRGLVLLVDGRVAGSRATLGRLSVPIAPPPPVPPPRPRVNVAVNNGRGAWPLVRATFSAPDAPPYALVDGTYRYTVSPPNRWTDSGSTRARESLVLDFGAERAIDEVTVYLLDDGAGSRVRAPARYDVETWTGERWVPAPVRERVPARPTGHMANHVRLARTVRTSRIRVVLTHRAGAYTGLTELEAWSDAPPPDESTRASDDLAFGAATSASFAAPGFPAADATDLRVAFSRYSRNRWSTVGSPNARDSLELDLGGPRDVETIEAYLWGDGDRVRAPRAMTVELWDAGQWHEARVVARSPERPATWAANTVRIAPARASRIRVTFTHDAPAATAVTELMVWGPARR